jgi:hypothetical protein
LRTLSEKHPVPPPTRSNQSFHFGILVRQIPSHVRLLAGRCKKIKKYHREHRGATEGTEKRARSIELLREEAGVELERGGEMLGEVGGVVAAGIEMEFVGDAARGEDFVESGGAGVEAVVVVVAAVEVDF